ncbi:hypothetical protein FWC31_02090 [Candidatus Saccharibacteria bacterium]|nr:hypothetical protein [Candidatus Saccharibacteria bacterium]
MILTGQRIFEEISKRNIVITPFETELLNPNSYNYRLGTTIYEFCEALIDSRCPSQYKEIKLSEDGYLLMPHRLYLASTHETIGSSKYAITLIGRSSVGRLGLFLQISAPLGHVRTNHAWTLELTVVQPLRVYPKMRIGQVSFWEILGSDDLIYSSDYWKFSLPEQSKLFRERLL